MRPCLNCGNEHCGGCPCDWCDKVTNGLREHHCEPPDQKPKKYPDLYKEEPPMTKEELRQLAKDQKEEFEERELQWIKEETL